MTMLKVPCGCGLDVLRVKLMYRVAFCDGWSKGRDCDFGRGKAEKMVRGRSYIYHRVKNQVNRWTMMFINKGRTRTTRGQWMAYMWCDVTCSIQEMALCATVRSFPEWYSEAADNNEKGSNRSRDQINSKRVTRESQRRTGVLQYWWIARRNGSLIQELIIMHYWSTK